MGIIKCIAWECDAPRCRVTRPESDLGERPEGFYGTVTEISGEGGSGSREWYACQITHIAPAVRAMLGRRED